MMNRTLEVFNATASTYDTDRSKLIPCCDAFYRWAINLIPSSAKTIVDLGAGSGLLTQLIRDRFPEAHIHLIDFSGSMLELARKRLGIDARITFYQANYVTDSLPEQACAIVSALSIHHLEDSEKQVLFNRAYQALLPRGVFINADQVAGSTPDLETRYKNLWLEQVRAAGATEQQISDSLYRQQEDRCASTEDQLAWMRTAGFADADCWFKDNRFAVLAGTRPE